MCIYAYKGKKKETEKEKKKNGRKRKRRKKETETNHAIRAPAESLGDKVAACWYDQSLMHQQKDDTIRPDGR